MKRLFLISRDAIGWLLLSFLLLYGAIQFFAFLHQTIGIGDIPGEGVGILMIMVIVFFGTWVAGAGEMKKKWWPN